MIGPRLTGVILLAGLASCGYRAPVATNTASPTYRADVSACRDEAATSVNARNAKTGLMWFASPVTRWSAISEATGSCMAKKGYGQVRWCTADELKNGARGVETIVTAAGLQCVAPGSRGNRPAT